MTSSPQQYVTLVGSGGTPVRLADQKGRPYPTTGEGALVFSENPTIRNATLITPTIEGLATLPINGALAINQYGLQATADDIVSPQCWAVDAIFPTTFMSISSGTYDNSTGVVVLILTAAATFSSGIVVGLQDVSGTANFSFLNGDWVVSGVSGTQVTLAAKPGFDTDLGGATSLNGGKLTTPATTCNIRLKVIPETVPAQMTVRNDFGYDGRTFGQHPATGTWAVTATSDPRVFTLPALWSTGSVSIAAHAYEDKAALINAAPAIQALADWLTVNGGGTLLLPAGGLYCQLSGIRFPTNCTVVGQGGQVTFFFVSDRADQASQVPHVLSTGNTTSPNVVNVRWKGFTVYGNREKQVYNKGQHAVDLGGDANTAIPLTIRWEDVHVFGSAGYGTSLGGHNLKADCYFTLCSWLGADSDTIDIKNRLKFNRNIHFTDCKYGWNAFGDMGTALRPLVTFGANPFTTTNGSSLVSIARGTVDPRTRAGTMATFAGPVVTFNGVNLTGSFPVTVAANTTITVDVWPQVANASGSGGGTGVTMFAPVMSVGDVLLDMRGDQFFFTSCSWEGWTSDRNLLRQRGGDFNNPNGPGGTNFIARGINFMDRCPAWIGLTQARGRGMVTILGDGASVSGIRAWSAAQPVGIDIGTSASEAIVGDFRLEGCGVGISCAGARNQFYNGIIKNASIRGASIFGYADGGSIDLPSNPFNAVTTGLNPIVNVFAPEHDLATGNRVQFTQFTTAFGVIIRSVNQPPAYIITVIDDDNIQIQAAGTATSTASFGGALAVLLYTTGNTVTATDNILNSVAVYNDLAGNNSVGWNIGTGVIEGAATNTQIALCREEGSDVNLVDSGVNTQFAIGNVGLPNYVVADTVSAPGLTSAAWELIDQWDFDAGDPTNPIEFTTLGSYKELWLQIYDMTHNGAAARNYQVQVSSTNGATWVGAGYSRIGAAVGTGDSFIFAQNAGAATIICGNVQISQFNQATNKFATVRGGQKNGSSNLQSVDGFLGSSVLLNAIKVYSSQFIAGEHFTAGQVLLLGKQ